LSVLTNYSTVTLAVRLLYIYFLYAVTSLTLAIVNDFDDVCLEESRDFSDCELMCECGLGSFTSLIRPSSSISQLQRCLTWTMSDSRMFRQDASLATTVRRPTSPALSFICNDLLTVIFEFFKSQ